MSCTCQALATCCSTCRHSIIDVLFFELNFVLDRVVLHGGSCVTSYVAPVRAQLICTLGQLDQGPLSWMPFRCSFREFESRNAVKTVACTMQELVQPTQERPLERKGTASVVDVTCVASAKLFTMYCTQLVCKQCTLPRALAHTPPPDEVQFYRP